MHRIKSTVVLALLTCIWGNTAQAGDRAHLNGFFLRLSVGGGVAESKVESGGSDLKFSGATGDLNFAIGAIVGRNLALHGTIWGWTMTDPDVTSGSTTVTATNADFTMAGVGAGITYYFMPANIYISPSIGLGSLSLEGGGASGETDAGVIFDLTLGKEWWVGTSWGLGVAVAGSYHSIPDGGVDANWKGPGFAVRFTATYN